MIKCRLVKSNRRILEKVGAVVISTWLAIGMPVACNSTDKRSPFGPSATTPSGAVIVVIPARVTVSSAQPTTFTATGGTGIYSWSVSDPTLGTIDPKTGILTVGNKGGTLKVSATDTRGAVGSGTVTVIATASQLSTTTTLTISPTSAQVLTGGTQVFTVPTGGTGPFTCQASPSNLGVFTALSGTSCSFIAGGKTGTATITMTDTKGNSGTATITVNNATILVLPGSFTFSAIGNTTFTTVGTTNTVTWSMANNDSTSLYAGATIAATTGIVTVTAKPTALQGTQTLTVTASDGISTSGTATVTVNP